MKKDGNKLPVKSQMKDDEKPAKKVMQAIGQSLLKPANPNRKKKARLPNGQSTANTKKQDRVEKPDMSKDADDQD